MTRVQLPDKQWAAYGFVRDVWLSSNDLPYRMVCFSARDIGTAVGINPERFYAYLGKWGWEAPKYRAKQAWMKQAAKGLTWEEVRVYTYPEAAVVLGACMDNGVTNPTGFGKKKNPTLARQINAALWGIREELEALYD